MCGRYILSRRRKIRTSASCRDFALIHLPQLHGGRNGQKTLCFTFQTHNIVTIRLISVRAARISENTESGTRSTQHDGVRDWNPSFRCIFVQPAPTLFRRRSSCYCMLLISQKKVVVVFLPNALKEGGTCLTKMCPPYHIFRSYTKGMHKLVEFPKKSRLTGLLRTATCRRRSPRGVPTARWTAAIVHAFLHPTKWLQRIHLL